MKAVFLLGVSAALAVGCMILVSGAAPQLGLIPWTA
jgi:hypothetical protein